MISAVKIRNSEPAGFTLLEIVIVLLIVAIVLGSAVGLMYSSGDERKLRNLSGEVELLAKRARTASILHQTSYALQFSEGAIRLIPWARASAAAEDPMYKRPDTPVGGGRSDQVTVPADIAVSLLRWNSNKWMLIGKNVVQIWRFDPDGLCEPVTIQYAMDQSWARDTYHPLTASVSDSELEAK